jgi:protein-S-isoprenylcysteine O-methyltransferase Ste14
MKHRGKLRTAALRHGGVRNTIMRPSQLFAVIWIVWIVSWMAAAFWSARTERRAATWEVWAYRALIIAGAIFMWHGAAPREVRLWRVGYDGGYALAAVTLAGVAFTWWARLHLGRLWSSEIARKEGHRIVDTGPYALVRHPIYTGLIAALLATAAAQATPAALLGAALVGCGLWLKARAEERFLIAELGSGAYDSYRRRVPMLIPGVRTHPSGESLPDA